MGADQSEKYWHKRGKNCDPYQEACKYEYERTDKYQRACRNGHSNSPTNSYVDSLSHCDNTHHDDLGIVRVVESVSGLTVCDKLPRKHTTGNSAGIRGEVRRGV